VFDPRDNGLDSLERLYQLVYTWYYGEGQYGIYNTENASTRVLLDNLTHYWISSTPAEIDGYSTSQGRQTYPMGTWVLYPGYHYFQFRVTGTSNYGYKIGLDQLTVSATGEPFEAEYFIPPYSQYGATAVAEDMSRYSGWSNNSQLHFPAMAPGRYINLQIHNDMWLESTFNQETAVLENVEITYDSSLGENVCQMIGNRTTWDATVQTLGALPQADTQTYENATLRVVVTATDTNLGRTIIHRGKRGSVTFAADPGSGKFNIESAYIMRRTSDFNGDPATIQKLTFANAVGKPGVTVYNSNLSVLLNGQTEVTSDLFDLEIDPEKEYIVSMHISATAGEGSPTSWVDTTGTPHTYMIANDMVDYSAVADWSTLPAGTVTKLAKITGVSTIFATYPDEAIYTSRILDTRMADPTYMTLTWRELLTGNTDLKIRIRSGDQPDLSDAAAWNIASVFNDPVGPNLLSVLPTGRYVQWQAEFESGSPYTDTAKLRDVAILWPGARRGVDVSIAVEKNVDMGRFELRVDGQEPSPAALNLQFDLREMFQGQPFERRFAVEATPRNE
jgi:hypothetical protein